MHTIRLREPWDVEVAADHVLYRRHFNRPTGLGPGDAVRLVVENLPPETAVSFNKQPLSAPGLCWDITSWLQLRNAIEISVPAAASPFERPFGEVKLEISGGSANG